MIGDKVMKWLARLTSDVIYVSVYIFRLLIKNGNNIDSPPVYDSYEVEYLPNEGVLSTGRYLFIEFTTDGTMTSTGAAIRYEGRCKKTQHFNSYSTDYLK